MFVLLFVCYVCTNRTACVILSGESVSERSRTFREENEVNRSESAEHSEAGSPLTSDVSFLVILLLFMNPTTVKDGPPPVCLGRLGVVQTYENIPILLVDF